MTVISCDPGLKNVGWAIMKVIDNRIYYITSGTIITESYLPIESRISYILLELEKLINIYKPTSISVEKIFVYRNLVSVISVANVIGGIMFLATKYKLLYSSYSPLTIKKTATGLPKADKFQIQQILNHMFNNQLNFKTDHESDAVAIGLTTIIKHSGGYYG